MDWLQLRPDGVEQVHLQAGTWDAEGHGASDTSGPHTRGFVAACCAQEDEAQPSWVEIQQHIQSVDVRQLGYREFSRYILHPPPTSRCWSTCPRAAVLQDLFQQGWTGYPLIDALQELGARRCNRLRIRGHFFVKYLLPGSGGQVLLGHPDRRGPGVDFGWQFLSGCMSTASLLTSWTTRPKGTTRTGNGQKLPCRPGAGKYIHKPWAPPRSSGFGSELPPQGRAHVRGAAQRGTRLPGSRAVEDGAGSGALQVPHPERPLEAVLVEDRDARRRHERALAG